MFRVLQAFPGANYCCAQQLLWDLLILEALLIRLPRKLEGQPRTYGHRKLTLSAIYHPVRQIPSQPDPFWGLAYE